MRACGVLTDHKRGSRIASFPEQARSCEQGFSSAKRKIHEFLARFIRDDSAQGTTEYILVLSVSVVGASQLIKQIIQSIDKGVLRLGGDLEKDLKTGRAPVSVWKN